MRLFRLRGASGRPQNLLLALALAMAGFLLAGTAQAQVAGITGTSHDLTTTTEGQQAANTLGAGNGEICAYCHTPHGGDTSAPAPLWNRSLASVNIQQRYSDLQTTTLQGEEAPVGSISLACLSCHDGVQAMDTVINAPGRGTSNNSGTTVMTGVENSLAVIGTDLRDDHPVSIQYCGGGIDSTAPPNNADCAHGTDYNTPQTDTINGNQVWWLDTDELGGDRQASLGATDDGIRQRTDIFLYSRADFTGGNTQPAVECGSCHDPHVDSPNTDAEVNFMRISNEGSAVCLTCHNK